MREKVEKVIECFNQKQVNPKQTFDRKVQNSIIFLTEKINQYLYAVRAEQSQCKSIIF